MRDKANLRRDLRERLRAEVALRVERSEQLCARLLEYPPVAGARRLAIFDPMLSEPAVDLLWNAGPRVFLYPRIDGDRIRLLPVHEVSELVETVPGARFREPAASAERDIAPPDAILVPGLGFTRDGYRLGRGGGYYDRLLAEIPPTTPRIGVCFSFQLLDQLPLEAHDERVHAVVTEEAVFACGR